MKEAKKKELKSDVNNRKNYYNQLILLFYMLVLIFTFFKVYNDAFDKKINLGGDNAGYYILGNAISSGQGFTNIDTQEKLSHNHFPPGYPLLIAGAEKLFSNNIIFIKKVNGFFLFLSIIFLFLIVYKLTNNYHLPFITSLFVLLNYHLLYYSVIMMSEIPFLFFSTFSIWLLMKIDLTEPLRKNWLFFVLIICVSFTYHIRSTGLALFGGIALFFLTQKNWKYFSSFVAGFILLGIPWFLRNLSLGGNAYIKQLTSINPYRPELGQMGVADWFKRIGANLERYITREIPSGTLDFIKVTNHKAPITAVEWAIGILCIILITYGIVKLKKFRSIILYYIIASFTIFFLWPEVWFGVRFLIPLIPILTFLLLYGIIDLLTLFGQKVLKIKNQSLIYMAIVIMSLLLAKPYSSKSINQLKSIAKASYNKKYTNYFELARWVKNNTADTSVTCCRKGQLFYLFSHRYVTGFKNTLNREQQIEYLQKKSTDYVVLDNLGYISTQRYLLPAMKRYPLKFKEVIHLKNPDTFLFRFLPEQGYWGDWKNNERNGKGIFVWENGMKYVGDWKNNERNGEGTFTWKNGLKFEGQWKNDKRNGKGTLFYTDGKQLEGVWTNDILNGRTVLKSKDGKIIERSIFKKNKKFLTTTQ